MRKKSNSRKSFKKGQVDDKVLVLNFIREQIEKGTGFTISELKKKYNGKQLFYQALKHVTTTKKPLSLVLGLPVEACCRYKCQLENSGLLVQSIEKVYCPYNTKEKAYLLSTNHNEFERLTYSNQLTFFD
jgi:hypothetical protein